MENKSRGLLNPWSDWYETDIVWNQCSTWKPQKCRDWYDDKGVNHGRNQHVNRYGIATSRNKP